jgi:hypothetical protein
LIAGKHLLILACSWSKNPDNLSELSFQPIEEVVAISFLKDESRNLILQGRAMLDATIDSSSKIPIPALDRYNGRMYTVNHFRETIAQVVRQDRAYVMILSGYYGVVTATERILKYNKELEVDHWVHHGLPQGIDQLTRMPQVTATSAFLNSKGPYQAIMRKADPLNTRMYFVRESTDPGFVYPTLGRAIIDFVESGFRGDSLQDFTDDSEIGSLSIGSEEL